MAVFNKIIRWALLVLFAGAFLSMALASHTDTTIISSTSILAMMIILFSIIKWLYKKISRLSDRIKGYLLWVTWLAMLVIQIVVVFTINVGVFGDPIKMLQMATHLANHHYDWFEWIRQYPNLVPLTALYTGFFHLSTWTGIPFLAFFYGFNVLVTSGIVALIFYLIWRRNRTMAVIAGFLSLITPFFYTFLLNVGYSDGPAILTSLGLILIYEIAEQSKNFRWGLGICTVLLFSIAYLMRPNIVILLAAFLLMMLLSFKQRKTNFTFQLNLRMFASSIVGVLLASQVSKLLFKIFHYNKNNGDVFPTLHWLYMGLNPTSGGKYTVADRFYTLHHYGFQTASQADWAGIMRRLSAYNPLTLSIHWLAKFFTLWSSGTFQTSTDYQVRWQLAPKFLIDHMITVDVLNETYTKAIIALLLLAIVIYIWRNRHFKLSSLTLILFFIIGISLFHALLWEVKIRYQFMTIGALLFIGYTELGAWIEEPLTMPRAFQGHKFALITLPILGVASILTMNLIPNDKLLSPVSSYRWAQSSIQKSGDHTTIAQGQQISQVVQLGSSSSNLQLITEYSQPLDLYIDQWQGGQWQPIITTKVKAHTLSQNIKHPFTSGKYRITLQNNTLYPAELASAQKLYTTPDRLLANDPKNDNSTLVFTFWRSSSQKTIYSPTVINGFTLLLIATWSTLLYSELKNKREY